MGWEEKNHDLFSAWNTSVGGRADSSADCLGRSLRSLSLLLWECLSGILLLSAAAAEKTRGLTFLLLTHKDKANWREGRVHSKILKCSLLDIICYLYLTFSVVIKFSFEWTNSNCVYSWGTMTF